MKIITSLTMLIEEARNDPAKNWTSDHLAATMFTTEAAAMEEAEYADPYGPGEAIVCKKQ